MQYSRTEADEKGYPYGKICDFHLSHPDQEAVMNSCEDCIYIDEEEEQELEDKDIRQ